MKKTKGFTLAEVLVGLSIVGITAALTIPQLVKTIQKVETGPKLSRAVQQFEVSSQDYFNYRTKNDNKASHYTKFSDIEEVSLDELATFWGLTPVTDGPAFKIDEYTEYAYIQQPLLIQSAYAAVNPNDDLHTGIGNNTDTTTNVNNVDLKIKCTDISTGIDCYEGDPGCSCGKVHVEQPGCDINTQEIVNGKCVNKCPEGTKRDNNGLCASICPENASWQFGKCWCDPGYQTFHWGNGKISCSKSSTSEPEPEPDPEPDPTPVTSDKVQFHSKKSGYDVFFEDNKIDTTGKTKNEDIVASFYLDTNGTKNRPNMKGKDLFKFHLRNDGKLEPEGLKDSGYTTNCADGGVKDGLACTARIVRDGYKIKY